MQYVLIEKPYTKTTYAMKWMTIFRMIIGRFFCSYFAISRSSFAKTVFMFFRILSILTQVSKYLNRFIDR